MAASDSLPPYGTIPPKGTRVYRGQRDDGGSTAGIHWTTEESVAKQFGAYPNGKGKVLSVELDDPEHQVIPFGHTKGQDVPHEKEVRLRPGSVFTINGQTVTIDGTKGEMTYDNLPDFAVTHEQSLKEWGNLLHRKGHTQLSLFGGNDQHFPPSHVVDREAVVSPAQFGSDYDIQLPGNWEEGSSDRRRAREAY